MKSLVRIIAICALFGTAIKADASVTVGVDPSANWLGYMNVFSLPSDGGGYLWGSPWGTADLRATFAGPVVTLSPNTISPPNGLADAYWYKADGTGNKTMDANFYVENSTTLPGQLLNFTGEVLANSLVPPYTSVAFIKDFAPDYSSWTSVTAPLVPGVFNIGLQTTAAGHHVQYGFETIGPNVWITNAADKGFVKVTAVKETPPVPEPSTLALFASSAVGLLSLRRNRKH
ncbi:MAG TPA: PEP-CTERM sorting domain-containing protein [Armatimonadota bacterium]